VDDADAVSLRDHRGHPRAEAHLALERRGDRLRQHARAAPDVPRQACGPAPDEVEVADAVAGRELLRLAGRPGQGRPEDCVDVGRQEPDELAERVVVAEAEHPELSRRRLLARPFGGNRRIAAHGEAELRSCPHERETGTRRERQPERIRLDPPAGRDLLAEGDCSKPARNLDDPNADLVDQASRCSAGATEHVRADVEPHAAAALGADPAADLRGRLQHDDVEVAQPPSRGQAGEPAADHDDLTLFDLLRAGPHAQASMRSGKPGARSSTPAASSSSRTTIGDHAALP